MYTGLSTPKNVDNVDNSVYNSVFNLFYPQNLWRESL